MNKRYCHFLKFQSFFLSLFFLISGGLSPLSAQITITSANIEQSLQSDFSATQSISSDTDNILSLIEINGADQEWDFTTLTFEEEYTGVYRSIDNPSEAPEGDDPHFAQATHATNLELTLTETIDDEEHEIFLDIFVFIDLSDEELISLGGVMTEGISDNDEIDDQVMVTYSVPGRVDAQFPLTFESSWEYDYEMVGVFGNDTSSTEFEVIVDGLGTL